MPKRCLVTGSKGFIGSHLTNYLQSRGCWVRGVDFKTDCYLPTKEDEFLHIDLRFFENAILAVDDMDWVFNLAADMGGIKYITELNAPIMRNNAKININMLDASYLENVERYFFSSSACVYNRLKQQSPDLTPLKESDAIPAWPDSAYGWEKLFTELLCKSYEKDYGLPVRIGRFHNIYGPFSTYKGGQEKAPAALCRKVAEAEDGGSLIVWGDGKQTRSYTYITDCLDAVYLLMQSNYSEPMNIGTSDLISVDDLAWLIMKIAGKNLSIEHDLDKPQGVRGRNADNALARQVLGWTPKVSLDEGMTLLFRWVESQIKRE